MWWFKKKNYHQFVSCFLFVLSNLKLYMYTICTEFQFQMSFYFSFAFLCFIWEENYMMESTNLGIKHIDINHFNASDGDIFKAMILCV